MKYHRKYTIGEEFIFNSKMLRYIPDLYCKIIFKKGDKITIKSYGESNTDYYFMYNSLPQYISQHILEEYFLTLKEYRSMTIEKIIN